MELRFIVNIFSDFMANFYEKSQELWPQIIAAIIVIILWFFIAYGVYKFTMYVFKKFSILELIDKIWAWFEENTTKIVDKNLEDNAGKKIEKIQKRVRYDRITAKALSYYIFLLFFRWAIVILGIGEVEKFMNDLISYLPSLFVGIMIGYFGLRFANSVHDIIYQALELTKDKTSKIIAMGAKIIIMFFTLMIMLNYIKIVDQFIINALFLGFITTMTIAFGIAFWLWGKSIAKEILEGFRK